MSAATRSRLPHSNEARVYTQGDQPYEPQTSAELVSREGFMSSNSSSVTKIGRVLLAVGTVALSLSLATMVFGIGITTVDTSLDRLVTAAIARSGMIGVSVAADVRRADCAPKVLRNFRRGRDEFRAAPMG